MLAVFNLTVDEGKKLIAKGICAMSEIKKALKEGTIAIHNSTSAYFLIEELIGESVDTNNVWLSGIIAPKAMCVHENTQRNNKSPKSEGYSKQITDASSFPHTHVIKNGKKVYGLVLKDLYENMGENDIYIKGVNCYDADGDVGVLIGSADENGTIGRMCSGRNKNHYKIIACAGNEKFIPESVSKAAAFINKKKQYAMGIKVNLFKFTPDYIINEAKALNILTGAETMIFSAGGLAGAQGGVCIAAEGTEEQINKAVEICENIKGAKLPDIKGADCAICSMATCAYLDNVGTQKPWIKEIDS